MRADKFLKLCGIINRFAVDFLADQFRSYIKQCKNPESCRREPFKICKCMADVARADDDNGMLPVKRKD